VARAPGKKIKAPSEKIKPGKTTRRDR